MRAWPVFMLLAGCLAPVDLSPQGYRCDTAADCAQNLDCVAGLCGGTAPDAGPIQPLVRLHGPQGNELLVFEKDVAPYLARSYVSEGVKLTASTEPSVSTVVIYRTHKPSSDDYLLAINAMERDGAIANFGYQDDGVAFYAYPAQATAGTPVFRFQRGSYHRYAVGEAERDTLRTAGWNLEMALFRAETP